MKHFLTLAFVATSASCFAQIDYPEASGMVFERKHEVRLGTIKLLAGNSLDLGYERVLDRNRGFGANLLIGFDDYDSDFNQNFSLSPYYRFYFSKSEEYGAKGMFVEGFADFYTGKSIDYEFYYNYLPDPDSHYYYEPKKKNFFDIAAGVALGYKWVNTIGFVLEMKAGYGRNLLQENPNAAGIFRGDFSVGYRF